jgi:hypothetical protein
MNRTRTGVRLPTTRHLESYNPTMELIFKWESFWATIAADLLVIGIALLIYAAIKPRKKRTRFDDLDL